MRTPDLIDSGAAVEGKSRTEFVRESAGLHAIDVLLDQRVFALDPEQGAAFAEVLDNAPKPNDPLKALMMRPAPWAQSVSNPRDPIPLPSRLQLDTGSKGSTAENQSSPTG